eukprot:m.6095 g.6095  ORF g.6095 m.6095 type:complete len:310 (+) comp5126_c0_seq2:207-1136(+)
MAESKHSVVVMTANSNTGTAVVSQLCEAFADKVNVRAVVRKMGRAEDIEEMPIEIVTGDIMQRHMLGPVFADIKAAYFAVPNEKDRVTKTKAFFDACIEHGIEHGIILSLLGADEPATEAQSQFAEIEAYAKAVAGKPVKLPVGDKGKVKFKYTILRCAPFYQNFFANLPTIAEGHLYLPLAAMKLGHVDMDDAAKCVATILSNPGEHADKTYTLIGEYQAGNMLASTIAMKAGIHCSFETVPDEVVSEAYTTLGMSSWATNNAVAMYRWFREGHGIVESNDIETITGSKPRKFGKFVAETLKPLLNEM